MDTSFPPSSVSTFDNASHQEARRQIRQRQMEEMEQAFATATESWNDVAAGNQAIALASSCPVARDFMSEMGPYDNVNIATGDCEAEEHLTNTELDENLVMVSNHKRKPMMTMWPVRRCCIGSYYSFRSSMSRFSEKLVAFWGGRTRKQRLLMVGTLVFLPFMVIFIVVMTQVGSNSMDSTVTGDTPDTNEDIVTLPQVHSEIIDLNRHRDIRKRIVNSGLTDAEDLDAVGTAPNLAIRWITDYDEASLKTDHHALLQRYALAVLFFSTHDVKEKDSDDGKVHVVSATSWKSADHWMSEKGICMWHGVSCSPTRQEVRLNDNVDVLELNLSGNYVSGTIPSELAALKNIKEFDLGKNSFDGTIPISMGRLEELGKAWRSVASATEFVISHIVFCPS